MQHRYTNRLIESSSPYLLQHAHNPVDWYPWGEEAFEKARREDKLVLVSIGYSACHWCHVMEHECFEDEDVADVMNKRYICIKVDREERPDVDQIYMDAVQLITGRGGWPLNMFVLPDGRPLHGGTYFPKEKWMETLIALDNFYKSKKEEAVAFADKLTGSIQRMDILPVAEDIAPVSIDDITEKVIRFSDRFDRVFGGYNWAPKFPMPNNHLFFLHYAIRTRNHDIRDAVFTTLTKMAEGGIYDHTGGGFARYSTDHYWKVPHFEKMLYDNAQLLSLYAAAYREKATPLFMDVMYRTTEWLQREMMAPNGAFYSALDADSEGVEGRFYIWTRQELETYLGEDEAVFSLYYNVQQQGNWEHGSNILYKTLPDHEILRLTGKDASELHQLLERCHQKLLQVRNTRIRPGLDDKIIVSWNALTITGLADCYRATGDTMFLQLAENNATYLLQHHLTGSTLMRIGKNNTVTIPAFAEDYACMAEALLTLYSITGKTKYAREARALIKVCEDQFYDRESGLFFFNAHDAEQLVARRKDLTDDVMPSSNSVIAKCLYQLSYLFGEPSLREKAERMVHRIQPKIDQYLNGYANWLDLMLWMSAPYYQVVFSGEKAHTMALEGMRQSLPHVLFCQAHPNEEPLPLTTGKQASSGTCIYVCVNETCLPPAAHWDEASSKMLF